jgi:hypothetical protein
MHRQACDLSVSDAFFGNGSAGKGDPCNGQQKWLAASVSCSAPPQVERVLFEYNVTVPTGSVAHVVLPTMGAVSVTVTESEATVWKDGRFVTGAAGVIGAAVWHSEAGHLAVEVGSGAFNFRVHGTHEPVG